MHLNKIQNPDPNVFYYNAFSIRYILRVEAAVIKVVQTSRGEGVCVAWIVMMT